MLCCHYVQRQTSCSEGFVFTHVYEVLLWDFTGKDVLGTVCSLLSLACDSAFHEDEGNVDLTATPHAALQHLVTSMHALLYKYVMSVLCISNMIDLELFFKFILSMLLFL